MAAVISYHCAVDNDFLRHYSVVLSLCSAKLNGALYVLNAKMHHSDAF